MLRRHTLPLSLLVTGLAFFPFTGACSTSSSRPSAERGFDAARSSSSPDSSGIWMGGAWDSSVEADTDVPEGGAEESGGDVNLSGWDSQDAGPDVTVSETGATESGTDATGDGDGSNTVTGSAEAGTEAGAVDSGMEASTPCVSLTVLNYEVWCSVTVNGGAAFVADAETFCVPSGTEQLAATAVLNFELGPAPWHDTVGDKGDGDPGTVTGSGASAIDSTTVVVGDAATCVWVCCPFDDGVGCPTTDQCP
jgi:hypothetical protein